MLLCACGGGGGGGASPGSVAPPPAVPSTVLRIVVPTPATAAANQRTPAFVSPGAQSIAVAIYPVSLNGTIATTPSSTTNVDLVPGAQCSGTPLACSIPVVAPIGTVTFSVTLYAQTGETGSVLSTFLPSTQHEFTIVQNATNVLGISLNGVPAALSVSTVPATLTAGTASTATLTVVARDASNNIIVGADPYATPITLIDGDPTAHTTLSAAAITSPLNTVTLTYAGGALTGSSFNIVAHYPATPTPITGTASVGILNTNGVTAVPASLAFLSTADPPIDVTYGEAAYAGTFTVNSSACAGIANVIDNIGSLHVTPLGHGSCMVTIADNANHSASVTIGVTQTTVVGN
jgi:hypothetical protein